MSGFSGMNFGNFFQKILRLENKHTAFGVALAAVFSLGTMFNISPSELYRFGQTAYRAVVANSHSQPEYSYAKLASKEDYLVLLDINSASCVATSTDGVSSNISKILDYDDNFFRSKSEASRLIYFVDPFEQDLQKHEILVNKGPVLGAVSEKIQRENGDEFGTLDELTKKENLLVIASVWDIMEIRGRGMVNFFTVLALVLAFVVIFEFWGHYQVLFKKEKENTKEGPT